MPVWRGWMATSATAIATAPSWDDWCACQQRLLRRAQCKPEPEEQSSPFSDREQARLSFTRWLYQQGRLDLAQHDYS